MRNTHCDGHKEENRYNNYYQIILLISDVGIPRLMALVAHVVKNYSYKSFQIHRCNSTA